MEDLLRDLNRNISELESKVESKVESLQYLLLIRRLINNIIPLTEKSSVPNHKKIVLKILKFVNFLIENEGVISPKSFILLLKSHNLLRMLYNVDMSYELFDEELVNDWLKNYNDIFKQTTSEEQYLINETSKFAFKDKINDPSVKSEEQVPLDSIEQVIPEKDISVDDIIEKELDDFSKDIQEANNFDDRKVEDVAEEKKEEEITGSIPVQMLEIDNEDEQIESNGINDSKEKSGFSTDDLIDDISSELEKEIESSENNSTTVDQVDKLESLKEFDYDFDEAIKEKDKKVEKLGIEKIEKKESKKTATEPVLFAEANSISLDPSKIFDSPFIKFKKYIDNLNYVSNGFDTILNNVFVLSNRLKDFFGKLSSDKEIAEYSKYINYVDQMREFYISASDVQKNVLTYTTAFNENLSLLRSELNTMAQKISDDVPSDKNTVQVQFFKCFDNVFAFPQNIIQIAKNVPKTEILKNGNLRQTVYKNITYDVLHIAKLLGYSNVQINPTGSNLIFLNIPQKNIAIEVDQILESKATFKASVPQYEKSIRGVIGCVLFSDDKSCLLLNPTLLLQ